MIPHGDSFPANDCASEIPFVDVSFLNAFLVRPSVSSLTTYLGDYFLEVLVHSIVGVPPRGGRVDGLLLDDFPIFSQKIGLRCKPTREDFLVCREHSNASQGIESFTSYF